MDIKFTVNRIDFISRVISPASKLNEKVELILDTDETVYSITKMESGTHKSQITLFTETKISYPDGAPEGEIRLNIGDTRKILSALNQLTDDTVTFTYDGSALLYESPALSFRFALLVDEAMDKKTVAKNRIKAFVPKTEFELESEILRKLLSITSCMPTYDKMYLSAGKTGVRCLHTDKEQGASDRVEMVLAENFEGEPIGVDDSIIVTDEVFKFVAANKFEKCAVQIVDPGIVIFKIKTKNSLMEYIVPKRLR
jgi:hypothetical protein